MSGQTPISVMVVDDHRRVHQVIAARIDFIDDIQILAHAASGEEAIDLCGLYHPDVILMDILMSGISGIETTKKIVEKYPYTKIVAISSFTDHSSVCDMLNSGAVGYIFKDSSISDIEHTIRSAYNGHRILSPEVMPVLLQSCGSADANDIHLTPREMDVLKLLATGETNTGVGQALDISISTVKFHLTNIQEKLDAETRSEALVIAAKLNLI